MNITEDIKYIGVNDHKVDLFEGQYPVERGVSYNSYLIESEGLSLVMDAVEEDFAPEWLENIETELGDRKPDYLVVQHMEPDHAGGITAFMEKYRDAKIISSAKAFGMMRNFFGTDYAGRQIVIKDGDSFSLGGHTLSFVAAPMVHWPEVMVTYDSRDKVLFAADGFGSFIANDLRRDDEDWALEARRYYIGIVGKYGTMVQNLLKKASALDIRIICSLHGPVLSDNLGCYIDLYDKWSSYTPEDDGITVAYTSVYGHTKDAVEKLVAMLEEKGRTVECYDLERCDLSYAVASAFRHKNLILATTTYDGDIFPPMRTFIEKLTHRFYQKRKIGLIENGSWGPVASRIMKDMFEKSKDIEWAEHGVTIMSALNEKSAAQLEALAGEF